MPNPATSEERFDFIDSLRGIAILGVVAVHVGPSIEGLSPPLESFAAFTSRGVQLFFMLSAFTLTMISVNRPFTMCPFYIRRLFRIAPMFYLAMVGYIVLEGTEPSVFAPDGIGLKQVVLTLTFLNGWTIDSFNSIVPGGWSISCEAMFYLFFPLILRYIRSARAAAIACAVSVLVALAWSMLIKTTDAYAADEFLVGSFIRFSFLFNLLAFLSGILLYYIIAGGGRRVIDRGSKGAWLLLTASIAVLIGGGVSGFSTFRNPLIAVVALLPFVYAVYLTRPIAIINPVIRHIGLVSFSVYLVHFAILDFIGGPLLAATSNLTPDLKFVVFYAAAVAISTLVATATYRWIELPFIGLGRRVASARSGRLAARAEVSASSAQVASPPEPSGQA
ncbi:MAG: Acyltransferase family protein [Microvirga sp.]|nr:Acyltransferase family protein [Microvirga sp.]